MFEFLIYVDKYLFYLLNKSFYFPLLDNFFVTLTDLNKIVFIKYLLIAFIFYILFLGTKKSKFVLAILIVSIFISDQISSQFLKNIFMRLRPCNNLDDVRLLVSCGSGFSFPSSHATNAFTVSILLSAFYKNFRNHFIILAFLVGYSRIYVGVHYPFDVIFGFVIGFIISNLILIILKKFFKSTFDIVTV